MEAAAVVAVPQSRLRLRVRSNLKAQKKSLTSTATMLQLADVAPICLNNIINLPPLHKWHLASYTTLVPCTLECSKAAFPHPM